MAKKQAKSGTVLEFIGGVNRDRIGGNCSVIAHTEKGKTTRVMYDLGTMFTPYESGFTAALPNVEEYFDRLNPENDEYTKATHPVSALFFTHAHEDHIGALIDYTKMGYKMPPIYASRFTRALIRLAFKQEGIVPPEIETIKPGQQLQISDDMVVEPFTVSHSVVGAMGFHTLTFIKDKPHAGIINNGDFLTQENMPVGESFSLSEYEDLLKRKLTTHVLLDSTSTRPNGKERIGFEQAVNNSIEVINQHPECNVIISPVISRSIQNIYIDCENARRLGTKICLDGKWLSLAHQAMELSGYEEFDDVLYKGKLDKYLMDKGIKKKYIVCTGAFAQGLKEYDLNQSDTSNIPMASATKMALDLHKDLRVGKNVLVLARQRIIDEINGETGPKMLQLLASKGAKVVMSPSTKKVGNIETVQMQDSGHINAVEMGNLMEVIKRNAPQAVIIPIHGNPEQSKDTAEIAIQHGLATHLAANMVKLQLDTTKTDELESKESFNWIGVKKVFHNPLKPDPTVPYEGKTEYWHIDEWYMPLDKIGETVNVRISSPKDKNYRVVSTGKMFDDENEDLVLHEPMKKEMRTKKISRKEKGETKTKSERDIEKREELKRRKAEKKAKEQARLLKKLGKTFLD